MAGALFDLSCKSNMDGVHKLDGHIALTASYKEYKSEAPLAD